MYYNTMLNSCDCGYSQDDSANNLPGKMMDIVDRLQGLESQIGYIDKDSLKQNITQLLCDIDKLHLGDKGIKEGGALIDTLKAARKMVSSTSTAASLNQKTVTPGEAAVAKALVSTATTIGKIAASMVLGFMR